MEITIDNLNTALDNIRPFLQADGGNVEVVDYTEGVVKIRLLGACNSCEMSNFTMKAGIEESIKKTFPSIQKVEAVK